MVGAGVTFRDGGVGDGAALAVVHLAARAEMAYLPVLHPPEDVRDYFESRVLRQCEVTVAETAEADRGGVVGFSAVGDGWLEHLYVLPAWQSRGIGGALLERAMAEHAAGLSLWVFEENDRATAFYRRAGFVVVERTDGRGNEEQLPDLRMSWRGGALRPGSDPV